MATTSLWKVEGWLGKVLIYIENPNKTKNPAYFKKEGMSQDETQCLSDVIDYAVNTSKTTQEIDGEGVVTKQHFTTSINCRLSTARTEMLATKTDYGKEEGIVAFHGYQSFAPWDNITPELAHKIGMKLAQQLWGEKYQVIVATHLDKSNHLHNHFVINSVSYKDGKRFYRSEKDYYNMKTLSDQLCREYGLDVIKNPKYKSKHYAEWKAEKEGKPTWKDLIKADVDTAITNAISEKQLFYNLKKMGYEIKRGKDITVRPQGKERGIKIQRNFGDDYSFEAIMKRILAQPVKKPVTAVVNVKRKTHRVKGSLKNAKKATGFRGLYYHYCYKLGVFPKNKQSQKRAPFLIREDVTKMKQINREIKLLVVNKIDTTEQLFLFQSSVETKIEILTEKRKGLYRKIRTKSVKENFELLNQLKSEITIISKELKSLRQEVKSCNNIAERSVQMKDKLEQVRKEREVDKNESQRRRSRANRWDDTKRFGSCTQSYRDCR